MTKLLRTSILIGLLLVLPLFSLKVVRSAPTDTSAISYQFAFINEGRLGFVNPNLPNNTSILFTLTPASRGPITAKSPDGKWIAIAMLTAEKPTTQIELFDVLNGKESSPIQVGNGFFTENQEINTYENLARAMSWSPDSRYLALSMYRPNHADIFVYNIQTLSLTDLTMNDLGGYYGVVWDNSSDRFVTANEPCPNDAHCTSSLTLKEFDLTGLLLNTIDVSNLYVGPGGKSICNMAWSPTDNYVSFQSSCDLYRMSPSQEIYIWDLSANKIQQVTHLTKFGLTDVIGPWAYYKVLWLNSDKMLVSAATYSQNTNVPQTTTFSYMPSQNLQTNISSNYFDNWSMNPVSGQLAYNMVQLNQVNQADPNAPATSTVKLAAINTNTSSANILQEQSAPLMAQIPNGCDLAWSPDGRYLAYASGPDLAFTTSSQCSVGHPTSIGFVDTVSGTITQYPLPNDSHTKYYIPIGWVVAPGQGKLTATASPTATAGTSTLGAGSVPGGNQVGG